MKFGNINAAYLLWLIAGIAVFYIFIFRRKKNIMELFAERKLLDKLLDTLDLKKQYVKKTLITFSVFLCVLSLMRPQWGFRWEEVKIRALDILIAIDTSKSMLAQDVKPNRLERSKLAVKDLVKKLNGDRIGLISFAGEAFLQCPLTIDYNGFMLSLDDLSVGTIPVGGTSISGAIEEAIKSYEGGQKKYKILIIITDGEDLIGDAVKTAEKAKDENIVIFSIGIGTKEGELIPIVDEHGFKSYLRDREGNFVKSRLDETSIQKIALATGGSYVRATGTEFGLDLIYDQRLSKMERRDLESKMRKRYHERFQIPLAFAIMVLLIEPFINERKKRDEKGV